MAVPLPRTGVRRPEAARTPPPRDPWFNEKAAAQFRNMLVPGTIRSRPTLSKCNNTAGSAAAAGEGVRAMLNWVITFLIIALIAAVLGFGGIAGAAVEIAKVIFFIAILLFLVTLVMGMIRRGGRDFPR
jgi:uncharacterized membrane protein YtjA (UPF0391 family)